MEQRDYLVKEIEKIGVILGTVLQPALRLLLGGDGNAAITLEHQMEDAKGKLLNEVNFDLDKFLDLSTEDSNEYILSFAGFSLENIGILAECLSETGFSNQCDNPKKYLEKALQLYNLCNLKSKTYSLEKETKINAIRNVL